MAGAVSLRDDMRAYLPDVLPKFIALFQEAEREGSYQMVQPALDALEALGPALEDHLQLLLPALVLLIPPGADLVTAQIPFFLHSWLADIMPLEHAVAGRKSQMRWQSTKSV